MLKVYQMALQEHIIIFLLSHGSFYLILIFFQWLYQKGFKEMLYKGRFFAWYFTEMIFYSFYKFVDICCWLPGGCFC